MKWAWQSPIWTWPPANCRVSGRASESGSTRTGQQILVPWLAWVHHCDQHHAPPRPSPSQPHTQAECPWPQGLKLVGATERPVAPTEAFQIRLEMEGGRREIENRIQLLQARDRRWQRYRVHRTTVIPRLARFHQKHGWAAANIYPFDPFYFIPRRCDVLHVFHRLCACTSSLACAVTTHAAVFNPAVFADISNWSRFITHQEYLC